MNTTPSDTAPLVSPASKYSPLSYMDTSPTPGRPFTRRLREHTYAETFDLAVQIVLVACLVSFAIADSVNSSNRMMHTVVPVGASVLSVSSFKMLLDVTKARWNREAELDWTDLVRVVLILVTSIFFFIPKGNDTAKTALSYTVLTFVVLTVASTVLRYLYKPQAVQRELFFDDAV